MELAEKTLCGDSGFPVAVAKSASEEMAASINGIKNISGFGFSLTANAEQARVLRVLADQVESGDVVIQAVTFEEMTDVNDFAMFRWSVKFAQRQKLER